MADGITQGHLDRQAEEIADCLNELPWCESTGFLVVEEEDEGEPDADLNQYLQAFDVNVFDGFVTDFMRLVRSLHDGLRPRFESQELRLRILIPHFDNAEDPNQVPLSLIVHYDGQDEGYLAARKAVLDAFDRIVREAVDDYAREEEEEESLVETIV
jgi:hypothetical protein